MNGTKQILSRFCVIGTVLLTASVCRGELEVVLDGLDNPRGLSFAPDGALYVVEAGRGGGGPSVTHPALGQHFFGASGSVTRLDEDGAEDIVSGLPSLAPAGGREALGVHDVLVDPNGQVFLLTGLGFSPAVRSGPLASADGANLLGQILRVESDGSVTPMADLAAFESAHNPDGGILDSNPYTFALDGDRFIVADAAANAVVAYDGATISELANFSPRPNPLPFGPPVFEAVPTAVAIGPDEAVYVGELTGFPFPQGAARVHRIAPGESPQVYATGLTNIVDLAFDAQGRLHVLEIDQDGLAGGALQGALIRIEPDFSQTVLVSEGLVSPTSLTIGPDGAFYISNNGTVTGGGQVVRFVDELSRPSGDYNGNGLVEQADLDLVLLNWGANSDLVPGDWAMGIVDQQELDHVLLHWGEGVRPLGGSVAVPEPSGLLVALAVVVHLPVLLRNRVSVSRIMSS